MQVQRTYCQRMKAFLSCRIPNLVAEHTVFQSTLLRQECGTDSRLLVGLELIVDLWQEDIRSELVRVLKHTKRSTTDDLPTAASPVRETVRVKKGK